MVSLPTPRAVADDDAFVDFVKADPANRELVAGFRMEGAAEVEIVFGDSERYKSHVDLFYRLRDAMDEARTSFSRHVQASLAALSTEQRRRCPIDALAPLYFRAHADGELYRRLGAEFETQYHTIRRLDALGETIGLTPDYRWRINRIRGLYRTALVDYREMRLAFINQLGKEISFRRCNAKRLLERGADTDPVIDDFSVNNPTPRKKRKKVKKATPVPASPVTFFVDNRGCKAKLRVYIDSIDLGEVAANAKGAFPSLAGRHSMCLLPAGSTATCGQKGTVRTAYIHDGWSISMYCVAK